MQSISLSTDKPLDPDKFFPFIQNLVQVEGPNILRSKGILSLRDDPQRFVFQGVHMMLDGDHQREWREGESAHEPRGVHRPQPARGEDPQGFRELRGVDPSPGGDAKRAGRRCLHRDRPGCARFAAASPSGRMTREPT